MVPQTHPDAETWDVYPPQLRSDVWCPSTLAFAALNSQPSCGRQPCFLPFCGLFNRGVYCYLPLPALPQGAPAPATGEHAGASPASRCPHAAALPARLLHPAALPLPAAEDHPFAEQGPWLPGQVRPTEGEVSWVLHSQRSLSSNSQLPVSGGMQAEGSFSRKNGLILQVTVLGLWNQLRGFPVTCTSGALGLTHGGVVHDHCGDQSGPCH